MTQSPCLVMMMVITLSEVIRHFPPLSSATWSGPDTDADTQGREGVLVRDMAMLVIRSKMVVMVNNPVA